MSDHIYEYRRWSNPNSYFFHELCREGHKFGYVKRRDLQYGTRFTAFKPTCKCRHKFLTWFHNKDAALDAYNKHVREEIARNPTLFEMKP